MEISDSGCRSDGLLRSLPLARCKAHGQSEKEVSLVKKKLTVGTKEEPPFSMKDNAGRWTGISIDLWRQIAVELNLTYEFRELDQKNLLAGLTDRTLYVVVSMLTITPERLDKFDFTYPFILPV
jgi:ABC-type amino acid transport substrate-binding protein